MAMGLTELVFATGNMGKLKEIRHILEGIRVLSLDDIGINVDIEETGATFSENAVIKANAIMKMTNKVVLADDSGIEIDFLGGKPGVLSARYLGADTPYEIKNGKILDMMKDVALSERGAKYVCVIAAAFPDGSVITSYGELCGRVAYEAAGTGGFGYDPIFFLPDYNMTVAEMDASEKNRISHRALALFDMKKKLDGRAQGLPLQDN